MAVKVLNRAKQVKTQDAPTSVQKSGSLFAFANSIFSDTGAFSRNINTRGQHTPVAFGRQTGWNDRGRTKGWNRAATTPRGGGKAPIAREQSYSLQQWTGNPFAAGKSGAPYAAAASRGGVPLELQPNPLTVGRASGQPHRGR